MRRKIRTKKKTELCKNWELYHNCFYGNECSFAHGIDELRIYDYFNSISMQTVQVIKGTGKTNELQDIADNSEINCSLILDSETCISDIIIEISILPVSLN